jgi:hypothetical protein
MLILRTCMNFSKVFYTDTLDCGGILIIIIFGFHVV